MTRAGARITAAPCISASAWEYVTAPPPCCPPACPTRAFYFLSGISPACLLCRPRRASCGFLLCPACYGVAMLPRVANAPACRAYGAGVGSKGAAHRPCLSRAFALYGEGRGKCSFSLHFPFPSTSTFPFLYRTCTVPAPYHNAGGHRKGHKPPPAASPYSLSLHHAMLPLCELNKRGLPCIGMKLRSLLFTFGQKRPCHAPSIRVFIKQPMLVPFGVMVA